MKRDLYIDFHAVEPEHYAIHERLLNWQAWCNRRWGPESAPGFELYISPARAREQASGAPAVDEKDALKIAGGVYDLPMPNRLAVNWCYLKPVNPSRAAREQGTTLEGLALLVWAGRQLLVDRGV